VYDNQVLEYIFKNKFIVIFSKILTYFTEEDERVRKVRG
jgi:hypothetical protein